MFALQKLTIVSLLCQQTKHWLYAFYYVFTVAATVFLYAWRGSIRAIDMCNVNLCEMKIQQKQWLLFSHNNNDDNRVTALHQGIPI